MTLQEYKEKLEKSLDLGEISQEQYDLLTKDIK